VFAKNVNEYRPELFGDALDYVAHGFLNPAELFAYVVTTSPFWLSTTTASFPRYL
jgi:hypothetical protein